MGKLNPKMTLSRRIAQHPDLTTNEEGGVAFRPEMKTELMLRTVSAMISEDGFYQSGKTLDAKLKECIHAVATSDPEFVLKLALYARKQMYLRTAPVVLMGEYSLAAGKPNVPNARKYIAETISRADEITELLAYVIEQNRTRKVFKGKIPQVIKFGIARAFRKFSAYQLAKYDREGAVKLKDALFMCHPKPRDTEQEKTFADLAADRLESADTWEVALSTKGASKKTWDGIVPAMGYMALLRNLANFEKYDVNLGPVIAKLTDPDEVHRSKQFPYRFHSAYRHVTKGKLMDALQDAMRISIDNIPAFNGTTFVACDNSGSMRSHVSGKSDVQMISIASLFGAMVHAKTAGTENEAIVSVFGDNFAVVPLSSRDGILTNMAKIEMTHVGLSTNAYLAIRYLRAKKIKVDRIVIFSDCQCYGAGSLAVELKQYKREVNPKVFTYSFDLASYGTTQFPKDEERVCIAGGFSDKILTFIPMFERSRADMLAEIEAASLP